MIASLNGIVAAKDASEAIIDVNGVGYRVFVSTISSARLPPMGELVRLKIRTVVREDALDLFGFLSAAEEQLFLLLTSVSGVGPRLAMLVLSGMEIENLVNALSRGEVRRLTQIHGVGKKTAERLVLELKDKVKLIAISQAVDGKSVLPPVSRAAADLVSALQNLGYKPAAAQKTAENVMEKLGDSADFESLFREALKALRSTA